MQSNQPHFIEVGQLQVGLYVHLDLGWMDHPFTLSNFKLKDEEQILKIKKIGLKKLRYDPKRSDCEPLPVAPAAPASTTTSATESDNIISTAAKDEAPAVPPKAERLVQLQQAIDENEKKFIIASNMTGQITRNILTEPKTCIEQATSMINDMVDTALMEGDVMMAKSIEMSKEDVRLLGMAALFHDIGKAEIAEHILTKKEPRTKSEQLHYEQHCEIGARIAKEVGLPVRVGKIILQHHEHADGTGFPNRLNNELTDPLARLVALANGYDNLCNPNNYVLAKTPYEALAHMYAHQRTKFDESLLKHLIKSLGIYPPGSIVQLSTGVHAIVISANPNKPLRPYVMLHDPLADRKAPRILDLRQEPNINISACIHANQLPPDVRSYLNPRNKISYFMDTELLKNEDGLN